MALATAAIARSPTHVVILAAVNRFAACDALWCDVGLMTINMVGRDHPRKS